jgi:GT2 family glycosyltransferase
VSVRSTPHLTVSIPTCERPDFAERAVGSVASAAGHPAAKYVQIVVSDNSADGATERAISDILAEWPGPTHYERNEPNVGMVGNFNRCVELAQGRWVQILHDDDYLLPGGLERMLARLPDEPTDSASGCSVSRSSTVTVDPCDARSRDGGAS